MRLEHADANRFFQLINRRYTRSSMIVTSNRRVSEWAELFGDEKALGHISLSRIDFRVSTLQSEGLSQIVSF